MKSMALILLSALVLFIACGGDDGKDADSGREAVPESEVKAGADDFSIDRFIDTVSSASDSVAALFLKNSIMEGDYKEAAQYLCRQNRELISKDSLMQYVSFGAENPDWDSLTAFKYEIIRDYIPVHASFNNVPRIKRVSCDNTCLFEYDVTGPLLVINVFNAALGRLGKTIFDAVIDSSLSIAEKREFYVHAFERLRHVADSMDFAKRLKTDTLKLIREGSEWKVCKEAKTSFDIFRQY
ncbi:MAG TPA: hypothetical protein ENO22_04950 [candidate division Zixibacteria bacterium]|nr:hypothetical protein [candidate division Zixibacteria bacterium]